MDIMHSCHSGDLECKLIPEDFLFINRNKSIRQVSCRGKVQCLRHLHVLFRIALWIGVDELAVQVVQGKI